MTKREGMIKALETMTDEEIDLLSDFVSDCKTDYLDTVGESCEELGDGSPYGAEELEKLDVLLHMLLRTRLTDVEQ